MKIGSIVETVGDFEPNRMCWGFPYPKIGDVLTVSNITEHPNERARNYGIVLLHFEEIPNLIGVCNKTIKGKPFFLELLLPDEIEELLKEKSQHSNKIIVY